MYSARWVIWVGMCAIFISLFYPPSVAFWSLLFGHHRGSIISSLGFRMGSGRSLESGLVLLLPGYILVALKPVA